MEQETGWCWSGGEESMWGSRQWVCIPAPCSRPGSYWHLSQDLPLGLKKRAQTLTKVSMGSTLQVHCCGLLRWP